MEITPVQTPTIETLEKLESTAADATPGDDVPQDMSSSSAPLSPSSHHHRRTSHRTLKRLQDEQLAASKFAMEKDVSYRLMVPLLSDLPPPATLFQSPTRAELSGDGASLHIMVSDGEEPAGDVALPFDTSSFMAMCASGVPSNKGIGDVMLRYVETCAERCDVVLGDNLVRVLLWMDKCIHDTLGPLPLPVSLDDLISNYDPMTHSRPDFDLALHRCQCLLNLMQLEEPVDDQVLKPRLLWLQIHLSEYAGRFNHVAALVADLKAILRDDVHLGHVKAFPTISTSAIEAKVHKFQLASLVIDARALFQRGESTDQQIADLVLPHYDPTLGQASHINELVTDVCVYLRNYPANTAHIHKPSPDHDNLPLLPVLIQCLSRLQRFDKCFEVLVLCFFYALQRTTPPGNASIQCIKYIASQLKLVFDKPFAKPALFTHLLDACCFGYRDVMLTHHKSAKMLHRLAYLLSPFHKIRFVGSILQTCHGIMDLRSKPPHDAMVSMVLGALQELNRCFIPTMQSTRLLDAQLAQSLCNPIAHIIKHQVDVGNITTITFSYGRRLLYTSCTSFALVWFDVHKGLATPCVELVRLLHDIMTTGDGLQGRGLCTLETHACSFLQVAKSMLSQSQEDDTDAELAQCFACLYGYSLLPTCVSHHGHDLVKATAPTTLMELFQFCQRTDKKLVRKESATLFTSVLELPDTTATLQTLVPVNDFQNALKDYLNPVATHATHVICPMSISGDVESANHKQQPNPIKALWFDLASNFALPKVKRRGRDYPQLLQYEVQCIKYIQYLRNDLYLHPRRAESYRLIAVCIKSLRAMLVDHWIVAWGNFTYPKEQSCVDLTPANALSFDAVTSYPFFKQFMEWIEFVQQAADDDDTSRREVLYKTREMSLVYAQYVAVLGELMLRCCDMAAILDPTMATACYEEAGLLVWKLLAESTCGDEWSVTSLAEHYFALGLLQPDVADEYGLRLNYMLGKVTKYAIKKDRSDCLDEWKVALEYFHTAETYRQRSDTLESLPHAFYQLHACRLKLLLAPVNKSGEKQTRDELAPSVHTLRLVNEYFYVKRPVKPSTSSDMSTDDALDWTQDRIGQLLAGDDASLWKARQHLLWNCLEAMERIPLDDRYFHPAYYMYAWGIRYGQAVVDLDNEFWADRCTLPSAVKAMKPLFDRKRQQVVAIWLSEADTNNLEELHQQQAKYDQLRLKYFTFYLHTMTLAGDSQRVSDLTSWVLSSKEEHWVVDAMLLKALSASSQLARGKLLDLFVKCLFPSQEEANYQPKVLAHLNRMYTIYLEYNEAWHRVRTSHE
ncbi:hypothetical protein DYB30_003877 [Aphanomyces astaci]|uniref:Uncharacterized protein n=1 Tax=Aphanomyces astaci TaxID=112090 RepID=A0A397EAI1_APHAT|nr:hypothetical protein DYB30_003877 [Aphanomyces astaci]